MEQAIGGEKDLENYAVIGSRIEYDVVKLNPEITQLKFTNFSKSYTLYYNFGWSNSGWGGHFFPPPYKAGEFLCT